MPLAALQVAFRILLHSMPSILISNWLSMAVDIVCHEDHFAGAIHHNW
jgi:hypothetical protein